MSDRSSCLDENAINALLAHELDETEKAAIDAHVDGCAECFALVATLAKTGSISPTTDAEDDPATAALPSNDALTRGTRIGRYEVVSLVGVGAMGAVYAAADPDLERTVALKLVRTKRGGDAAERRERLLREARTMARVAHPNVVAVHDVGTFGERVFVAMDLVEGQTLRQWLGTPRSTKEILAAFVAAGRGLAAAHEADVVHRDFKPENVLVGRDGRVLVTDFGLARDLASEAGARKVVAGTPAYMAPEQLRGEEVDSRADQFAFCVALHEALGRERPFRGREPAELLSAIEAQSFEDANAAPPRIRRIIRRGLSRLPDQRFPSMKALLDELERDPSARLRRLVFAALGLAAIVSAVVATATVIRHQRASCREGVPAKLQGVWAAPQRTALREAFLATKLPYAEDAWGRVARGLDDDAARWSAMHVEACDATHVRAEQSAELLDLRVACLGEHLRELSSLIDVLSHADASVVRNATRAVQSITPLRRCADALALRAVAPPPAERAEAVAALRKELAQAKALRDAGRLNESLSIAKAASQTSLDLGYVPLEAVAFLRLGEVQMEMRDGEAASESLRRAANYADTSKEDATRVHALTTRLFVEGFLLHHGDRIGELDAAATAAIARIGAEAELEGNRRHALGMSLLAKGELATAGAELEAAASLREKAAGAKSRAVAMSVNGLCLVADKRGETEKALAQCQRATDIFTEVFGPDHPDVALGLSNVGALLDDLGRYDEASARFERALAIGEAALGPEHPLVAIQLANFGLTLSKRGEHARAIALLERARAVREKLPDPNEPLKEVVYANLGEALLRAGELVRAEEAFERALLEESSETPPDARADVALGLARASWDRRPATRERLRKLVLGARDRLPPDAKKRAKLDTWLEAHR